MEDFAIEVVHLYERLPSSLPPRVFGEQLVDGARQDAQETIYWLRLISRLRCIPEETVEAARAEASELRDIDGNVLECPQARFRGQIVAVCCLVFF